MNSKSQHPSKNSHITPTLLLKNWDTLHLLNLKPKNKYVPTITEVSPKAQACIFPDFYSIEHLPINRALRQLRREKNPFNIEVNKTIRTTLIQIRNGEKTAKEEKDLIEKALARIEDDFGKKILGKLSKEKGNIQPFTHQEKQSLFNFIGLMLTRTERMRQTIQKDYKRNRTLFNSLYAFKCWIAGLDISYLLFKTQPKREIEIIHNNTDDEFIISDAPVLEKNTLSSKEVTADTREFFIPISPRKAIYLPTSTGTMEKLIQNPKSLQQSELEKINESIAMQATSKIWATTKSQLESIEKYLLFAS